MPRSERTELIRKRDSLIKERDMLQATVVVLEEQIEEIDELVRTKGPYTKRKLNQDYLDRMDEQR